MKSFIIYCVVALLSVAVCEAKGNGAANVTVKNTNSNPVPANVRNDVPVNVLNEVSTRAADHPALQRFDQTKTGIALDGNGTASTTFDVPAGKRLVIESVTLEALVPHGEIVSTGYLTTKVDSDQVFHFLAMPTAGIEISPWVRFAATHTMRAYGDAGTGAVTFLISRTGTSGEMDAAINISGYLVDLPAN